MIYDSIRHKMNIIDFPPEVLEYCLKCCSVCDILQLLCVNKLFFNCIQSRAFIISKYKYDNNYCGKINDLQYNTVLYHYQMKQFLQQYQLEYTKTSSTAFAGLRGLTDDPDSLISVLKNILFNTTAQVFRVSLLHNYPYLGHLGHLLHGFDSYTRKCFNIFSDILSYILYDRVIDFGEFFVFNKNHVSIDGFFGNEIIIVDCYECDSLYLEKIINTKNFLTSADYYYKYKKLLKNECKIIFKDTFQQCEFSDNIKNSMQTINLYPEFQGRVDIFEDDRFYQELFSLLVPILE